MQSVIWLNANNLVKDSFCIRNFCLGFEHRITLDQSLAHGIEIDLYPEYLRFGNSPKFVVLDTRHSGR